MRTYNLHFIRHGMPEGNENGQYIGRTDLKITTNGIIELENLRDEGIYPKCDLVFSSPLSRAVDTAKIIYPNKEVQINHNFKEIDFGEFEGKTPEDLKDRKDYADWLAGKIPAAPGGESAMEFATRLCTGIGETVRYMMNNDCYSAAIVMHGGAIMTLLAVAALPRMKMAEWACGTGRGYTISITPSLYQRSGILEVVGEIPDGAARVINGKQKDIMK